MRYSRGQTDSDWPGRQAMSGNSNEEATSCLGTLPDFPVYEQSSPPTGSSSAAHMPVCPPVTSEVLALGFLSVRVLAVCPGLTESRGTVGFYPETLLHAGKVLPSKGFKCLGPESTVPTPPGLSGEAVLQVCGARQDTRGARGVGLTWRHWEHFGNPDMGGISDTCSVAWERCKRFQVQW